MNSWHHEKVLTPVTYSLLLPWGHWNGTASFQQMASGGGWRVNRVAFGSVFVQHLPLLSSRHSFFWGCWEGCSQGPYTLCVCLQIPRIWLSSLMWGDRRSAHTKIGCKWMAEGEGCKSNVTWLYSHILLRFGLIYYTHKLIIWVYRSEISPMKTALADVLSKCQMWTDKPVDGLLCFRSFKAVWS